MIGLLVHGSNHFIVDGPLPDPDAARRLARHWENPTLTGRRELPLPWVIVNKAFRENLEWAVALDGGERESEAVARLLKEMVTRGVTIHRGPGPWNPPGDGESWSGLGWPARE